MATSYSRSPEESSFDVLLENIMCQMCQRAYNPKSLPCHHCYCKRCLEDEIKKNGSVTCLKCRQEHTLSEDTVKTLPQSELASEFRALHSMLAEKVSTDRHVVCELCTNDSSLSTSAQAYCHHCLKFLCSFCVEAHRRYNIYEEHTVLKFTEIPAILYESVDSTDSTPQSMLCSDHEEEVKGYCFDCDQLTCRECMVTNHKTHKCEFVKKAHEMILKDFSSRRASLERSKKSLKETQQKLDTALKTVEDEGMDASQFVNQSFDIVLKQFEKYRSNLLHSIRNHMAAETREVKLQKKKLESAQRSVESLMATLESKMGNESREQVIHSHQKILEQISECQMQCEARTESPAPQANHSFNTYRTSCARIIGAIGDSLKCANPIMCSLEGKGATSAELNREAKFILRINQSNDTPCTALQNVQVELNSIDDCQPCETRISILKSSMYEVSYAPKVQGRHILKVRVNERPILNNPFEILAKKPLQEAKEPVLIIRGVKKLHDLAIHRNGNLIATQYETGMIVKIDRKEKQMKKLLGGINQPYGLATNSSGWVFVTQNKKCCLQKYSKGSELIATVGCKDSSLGNFNRPGRLAVNKKGEVFVCDTKNSRVQVFDDDLEYVRWYSVSKPTGVAVDSEGDLYIAENGKNALCKVFVSSKLGQATIREGLSNPQGVYVDEDYVYVVERDSAQVTVLDHEGEFVTTLGKGVLREPGGIVGDDNGYLYVCDEKLEAICVF